MKIRILRPCFANLKHASPGEIVEVSVADARMILAARRGEAIDPLPAQQQPGRPPLGSESYLQNFTA